MKAAVAKVSARLSRVNFFSRREVAELSRLVLPDEKVLGVLSGFYSAGTATLCVTSKRLLLIDKKLFRLSYEDIRYESISEVSYAQQGFIASVNFYYVGRELRFRSWYRRELRALAEYVQGKMFSPDKAEQHVTEILTNNQKTVKPLRPQGDQHYMLERIQRWRKVTEFIGPLAMFTQS